MREWQDILNPGSKGGSWPTSEQWIRATGVAPLVDSAAWPTANLAVYAPIILPELVTGAWLAVYNGAVVSGNFDIGIYAADSEGKPGTKIVSTGSTAQAGTSQWQMVSINKYLGRGLYFLGVVFDNTTAQVKRVAALTTDGKGPWLASVFTQAAAFPLPASATPSASGVAVPLPYAAIMGL